MEGEEAGRGVDRLAPFPRKTDWLHFFLGFLAGLLCLLLPPVSLLLTTVYLVYQFTEREQVLDTYLDVVEYVAGWVLGAPLGSLLAGLGASTPVG